MAKAKQTFTPPVLTMDDVNDNRRANEQEGENTGTYTQDGTLTDPDWDPEKEPVTEEKGPKKRGRKPSNQEIKSAEPRNRKPIEIRAGKMVKNIFCHFSYDHNLSPTTTNGIDVKSGVPVHKDLSASFRLFIPHLAIIFGKVRAEDVEDLANTDFDQSDPIQAELGKFTVTSFKLLDYEDEEKIVLIGTEQLVTGEAKLETPEISFANSLYSKIGPLRVATDAVIHEIEEYLHGRKKAPEQQLAMFQHEEDK